MLRRRLGTSGIGNQGIKIGGNRSSSNFTGFHSSEHNMHDMHILTSGDNRGPSGLTALLRIDRVSACA